MERHFLITLVFSLFIITGCQTQKIDESTPLEVKTNFNLKVAITKKPPKNIWEHIIINSDNKDEILLDKKTSFFLNNHLKNKKELNDYLNKSYYFIYYVTQELEAANLPVELALIPFIESNYDPFSISPSGAVGLWQFMPKTGRLYNLEKSWWNEDRHDPFRSTHAAIGYFKYLFERFDNDIYLALAAYNAGPTYLERQINKNLRKGLETDFWSLDLNQQVTNYIPKYIAIREIVFNSEKYGVQLPNIPFESVVKKNRNSWAG
jgi:membrane-bound lytic murein transglycosylase D